MSMSKKDKQGVIMMIAVLLVVVSLFYLRYVLTVTADNIDPETLCRIGADDPVLRILIDKTDPWTTPSQQRLARLIRSLKTRLAVHERLSIHILDETGTYSPSPVFDMCNPGRADQANALYQNPRMMERKFEEKFAAPLDSLISTLTRPGRAPRSPLIETMKGLRSGSAHEKLIIVSDMMQNSEELSFYGRGHIHVDKDLNMCRIADKYDSIEVYYINRPGIPISRRQKSRQFWTECLSQMAWHNTWNNF